MKYKIKSFDPTGVELEVEEGEFPLIPSVYESSRIDGVLYEPMKKNRYLLEIGENRYWVGYNGELEKLGE
jgi:hypothetical protein